MSPVPPSDILPLISALSVATLCYPPAAGLWRSVVLHPTVTAADHWRLLAAHFTSHTRSGLITARHSTLRQNCERLGRLFRCWNWELVSSKSIRQWVLFPVCNWELVCDGAGRRTLLAVIPDVRGSGRGIRAGLPCLSDVIKCRFVRQQATYDYERWWLLCQTTQSTLPPRMELRVRSVCARWAS